MQHHVKSLPEHQLPGQKHHVLGKRAKNSRLAPFPLPADEPIVPFPTEDKSQMLVGVSVKGVIVRFAAVLLISPTDLRRC